MPKMKTHKGAARRFKITGTGQIMRTKHMKSHFRRRKSKRVKQLFDRMLPLDSTQVSHVTRLLPYGLK
ncbi:MAG: 50S ribosomal protein L35 [Chloroflexota bacterium]|nr:50S ribosomal protein L35 [Chloroflexota bacterium]